MEKEKYPEGHFVNQWLAMGISLGLLLGVPFALSIDNPAFFGIGLPIGVALGLAIGKSVEDKYRKEGKIRPLTKQEKKRNNRGIAVGLIALLVAIVLFVLIYFLTIK